MFGFSSANTLLTLNSSFIEPAGSVENEEYSHEDFISALKHRDQMPKTPAEWITKNKDGVSAYMTVFQEVGPFNLDVPMRKQFGLKPISGRKNVTAYAPSDPISSILLPLMVVFGNLRMVAKPGSQRVINGLQCTPPALLFTH